MSEPSWTPALLDVLADIGPATDDAIVEALRTRGHDVTEDDLQRELQARPDLMDTDDGWLSVWPLVEGAILTHPVTAEEIANGVLTADDDLDLWARLADDGLPLASGGTVRTRWGERTELHGPEGWLTGASADTLIGLRWRDGALHLETDVEPGDPTDETAMLPPLALLAAGLAAEEGDPRDGEADIDDIVLDLLRLRPGALAEPIPPLSLLLILGGLHVRRGTVRLTITDRDLGAEQLQELTFIRSQIRGAALLDDDEDNPPALREAAARLFEDPELLEALAEEVLHDEDTFAGLPLLARHVTEPPGSAVPSYLLAHIADLAGEQEKATQHLESALAAAPALGPALELAGVLAAERGDAFTAEALLRRAGQPSDGPDRGMLREFLKAPSGDLPRNRPCPCGSGRKYKACCGATPTHPLPKRATWRYRRAAVFALRPPYRSDALDLSESMGERVDPLAVDLMLFEEGVLADYLEQRGSLMPADERALVEGWLDARLGLYETLDTTPDRSVTLRRLPDGEPLILTDRLLSHNISRLDLVLARLLDDGAGPAILSTPRLIPRHMRPQLLEVLEAGEIDAYDVTAALAPPGMPQLRTSEGEEVVLCSARYEVADVDAVWQRLVDGGLVDDDDDLVELSDDILRGRLRRAGDAVTIETNSLERLRRLQARLLDAAPKARLISESSRPVEDLLDEAGDSPLAAPPSPDLPPDVVAQICAQLEDRWLAEQVPALDGLTPREAVADPGVRPKLVSLLDDFEWEERRAGSGQVGMRTARLRAELGL